MSNVITATRQWLIDSPAISDYISGRIYADFLPLGNKGQVTADIPALVYHTISDNVWYTGTAGDTQAGQMRLQLDHIALDAPSATYLENLTRTLLSGYKGDFGMVRIMGAFRENYVSLPMRDTQLARVVTDYTIQYQLGC